MHNTQRRDGLLVRNAQRDTTAQVSSSSPVVTVNTLLWEIIRVRLVALDTIAQPRMALRYHAAALAPTKSYSSKLHAQVAQQAQNVHQPPQFLMLAHRGPIL
jgi:hypothetical protein